MVEPLVKPTFALTALNCTAMLVLWEAISCLNNSGEPPVLLLQIAPAGQNFTSDPLMLYNHEQQCALTGLERGTRYIVHMAVFNSAGIGEWTENNEITQGDQTCVHVHVNTHIFVLFPFIQNGTLTYLSTS